MYTVSRFFVPPFNTSVASPTENLIILLTDLLMDRGASKFVYLYNLKHFKDLLQTPKDLKTRSSDLLIVYQPNNAKEAKLMVLCFLFSGLSTDIKIKDQVDSQIESPGVYR